MKKTICGGVKKVTKFKNLPQNLQKKIFNNSMFFRHPTAMEKMTNLSNNSNFARKVYKDLILPPNFQNMTEQLRKMVKKKPRGNGLKDIRNLERRLNTAYPASKPTLNVKNLNYTHAQMIDTRASARQGMTLRQMRNHHIFHRLLHIQSNTPQLPRY